MTIGEYQIGPFEVPPGAEKAKIKVKVKMGLHGLISVDAAENYVEVGQGGVDVGQDGAGGAGSRASR